jgi:hypothetical protein
MHLISQGIAIAPPDAIRASSQSLNPLAEARIASLSLLVPAAGDDLTNALRLADDAAVAEYADAASGWRQVAQGMAEYRRGQFANSLVWMDKALATAGQQNLPGWNRERERNLKAMAYLVESMARRQMQDPVTAQAALSQGMAIIHTQFPPADSGDLGRDWADLLTVQILLREAGSPIH